MCVLFHNCELLLTRAILGCFFFFTPWNNLFPLTLREPLGVLLREDLSWCDHVDYVIKKVNSRLYALRKLKKAGLSDKDLVTIYSSFFRSRIEYASPAWSTLTQGQSDLIESIQRRALRILLPEMSY
jgi:hypothetical protein